MPVQTSYAKTMRRSVNGVVAWDFGPADITSVHAEGIINFGAGVVKGAASRSGLQGSTDLQGFAVRSILSQYAINASFPGPPVEAYGVTETVAVLRSGYIWLTNKGTAAVEEGDRAYINAAGLFVDAATAGAIELVNSRIELGGAPGEVCLVRVGVIMSPAA